VNEFSLGKKTLKINKFSNSYFFREDKNNFNNSTSDSIYFNGNQEVHLSDKHWKFGRPKDKNAYKEL
jgi:hypothetical protein